jgi:two-component system response regulator DesR
LIRILLAQEGALLRAALIAFLSRETDFEVVGELANAKDLVPAIQEHQPDVAVLDFDLPGAEAVVTDLFGTPAAKACRFLVLMDRRHSVALSHNFLHHDGQLGFLTKGTAPGELLEAIRRLARGDTVLDPDLALAALTARHSPLTDREREVLEIAARGVPIAEIAGQLSLTVGTVRNYLSRSISKTGARTRIEAIRIAQDAGWIV